MCSSKVMNLTPHEIDCKCELCLELRQQHLEDVGFPDKRYQIIYADPPWSYQDKKCNGNALQHYQTMDIKDICELPVNDIADENCILFLWGTFPLLPEALRVIESWGFEYKTIGFIWLKLNKTAGKNTSFFKEKPFYGLGRWTRGNTEPCFIAVKGKPKRLSKSVFQIIEQPLQRHSQKPNEAKEKIIQLVGDLPRIELFARQKTEGWDVWGNEV